MNNYLLCEDKRISGIDEWSLIILGLQNNDFFKNDYTSAKIFFFF